ncbi:MAG: DUF3014 domain-containing protein [Deltaproteobacteria bacterium HGW-Deltaproteobacteria-12]|jgi:hypothetical protein|nr:MAG: DUF3014 domain-containing protein [Deltaproteobacteria bacterium HGW-Deltaproteobacteria-12]
MKKRITIAVALIIVVGGGITAYLCMQRTKSESMPQSIEVPMPAKSPESDTLKQIPEITSKQLLLPRLAESDKLVLDTLAELITDKSLRNLFFGKQMIRQIVATIDNLPRKRLPVTVCPVKRAKGKFITEGSEDKKAISPANAKRYSAYVKIAEDIDAKKLVETYLSLYPLFQQAYEELGYPGKKFHDRLMIALYDLLNAPAIEEPIKLIQPNVFYLYADQDLESRSAGQKILLRIGKENSAKIRKKLYEIRQQLILHNRPG